MVKVRKLDWIALASVLLLLIIGMTVLFGVSFQGELSAGSNNFQKQLVSLIIGLILMIGLSFFDYRSLNSVSTRLYLGIIMLLLLVIFFGTTIRGHTGWIGFGSLRFQPVEIAKIIMIIFLASFLSEKKTQLSIVIRIIASVVLVFLPVFLILKQPDFASAAVIVGIWIVMLFVSGISMKNFLILTLVGLVLASSSWFFFKEYQKERILNFVDPYKDPRGSGYNVIQSTVAVGSGGLFGKGLGHGSQSQLNFLPEKHTDFIFAVIGEELGFVGAMTVIVLFLVLLYRIKESARLARDNFGYLLCVGIAMMIFIQILVNIGMNMGITPVAGVPLPLLSYGGTSLVVVLASLGIVQSVYVRRIKTLD